MIGRVFVNNAGQVGGLLAPCTVRLIRDVTGSCQLGMVRMAAPCLLAAPVAALAVRR